MLVLHPMKTIRRGLRGCTYRYLQRGHVDAADGPSLLGEWDRVVLPVDPALPTAVLFLHTQ